VDMAAEKVAEGQAGTKSLDVVVEGASGVMSSEDVNRRKMLAVGQRAIGLLESCPLVGGKASEGRLRLTRLPLTSF